LTSFTLGSNLTIRISDLLGLKVKDVKDKKGGLWDTIRIREQKTNREAKLAVNEASKEALELYFEKNSRRILKNIYSLQGRRINH